MLLKKSAFRQAAASPRRDVEQSSTRACPDSLLKRPELRNRRRSFYYHALAAPENSRGDFLNSIDPLRTSGSSYLAIMPQR
jgi:hypothetical protein